MTWLLLSLLAPVLWAASNLIDERLVNGPALDAGALLIVTGLFASAPSVLLFGADGAADASDVLLAVLAGGLGFAAYYPYFRALLHESAEQVVLMWNLTPVLIAVAARVFIGERLSSAGHVAVAALVASSTAAAYRRTGERTWSAAMPWMIGASLVLAVSSVLEKEVYNRMSFASGYGWMSVGALVSTLGVTGFAPDSRRRLIASLRGRVGVVLCANEALDLGAASALALATSRGPVSLVHAVGGAQPLFVLLFQQVLAKRALTRAELFRTMLAAGLAMLGLGLLDSNQ